MNSIQSLLGFYCNANASSFEVPYLSFRPETTEFVFKNHIGPTVENFFKAREITNYRPLAPHQIISKRDFGNFQLNKPVGIEFFYKILCSDMKKNDSKVEMPVKFCISFDKECANLYCDKSKIHYGEILIHKLPILFYLHFEIQDIINFIREKKPHVQPLKF